MGKITQLSFAAISPGNVSANLMSANVTGGAAGQCADMMHDFKTGLLLGAGFRRINRKSGRNRDLLDSCVRPGRNAHHAGVARSGGRDVESGR